MKRRFQQPVAVFGIVSMFLFAGCFGVDGNFKQLRNDLLSVQNAGFRKDIEFSLGSTGLALVKAFVNHNNKDDNAKEILRYVSKVPLEFFLKSINISSK